MGLQLINDENFHVCFNRINYGNYGLVLYKICLKIRKDIGNWTYGVKLHTNQLAFLDKKALNSSISDYCMLHSMMGENNSDETFTVLCQSWRGRYFDGNGIKITLLNPNEDLIKEILL